MTLNIPDAHAAFHEFGDDVRIILDAVNKKLSRPRFLHSVATATLSLRYARRLRINEQSTVIAALAHDLCKEYPLTEQYALAGQFDRELPEAALKNDKLPHGPAAAVILRRDFGIDDPDILEAVAYHSFGKLTLSGLSRIVYCADKLEPGRKDVSQVIRDRCDSGSPESMMLSVLEYLIKRIREKGWVVASETLIMYNSLRAGVC